MKVVVFGDARNTRKVDGTMEKIGNLKCHIRKGMLDDEYLVAIDALDKNGAKIKMFIFAGKEELSTKCFPEADQEVEGILTVSLLDESNKVSSVVLPKPTFSNGAVVAIESSNLVRLGN